MELEYWNRAIDEYTGDKISIYTRDDIDSAVRDVSRAANWYTEQDVLLQKLARDRDSGSIREWAREMRDEMPDDEAWDQEFCDNVADRMDELADLIDSQPRNLEIEFVERGNGYPQTGDIVVDHDASKAYRVLDDIPGTGQGRIETHNPGDGNTTILRVEEVDYDHYYDGADYEV